LKPPSAGTRLCSCLLWFCFRRGCKLYLCNGSCVRFA